MSFVILMQRLGIAQLWWSKIGIVDHSNKGSYDGPPKRNAEFSIECARLAHLTSANGILFISDAAGAGTGGWKRENRLMGQKGPPNPHDSQTAWRGFIHRTSAVNRWGRELQQKQTLEGYSVSELGQICGRHSNVVPNSNKAVCLHRFFLSGGIYLRWRKALLWSE